MKYMLLMNGMRDDLKSFGTLSPEDIQAHVRFMSRLNEELKASGEYVSAEGLTMPVELRPIGVAPDA